MTMLSAHSYLMENDQETLRLKLKTDRTTLEKQALWAGIKPGMRVADVGCGAGQTTYFLNHLIHSGGNIMGIDSSEERIKHARMNFENDTTTFVCRNVTETLDDIGTFDFIWVRFFLEYYRNNSFEIVKNIVKILKPGGILCLIDLDHNCLNHYGASPRLMNTLAEIMTQLETHHNFDPYAGRKLYSYLYDLQFEEIDMDLSAHHLIFGKLNKTDEFNWETKAKTAVKKSGYDFSHFPGGFDEFFDEFKAFFLNPRRFTYTPVISCRGRKPHGGLSG
jgi:2-polyprenyl-3-methyl-5-hydroxy-6-metoxy-1,4-benzoquinol methylase